MNSEIKRWHQYPVERSPECVHPVDTISARRKVRWCGTVSWNIHFPLSEYSQLQNQAYGSSETQVE